MLSSLPIFLSGKSFKTPYYSQNYSHKSKLLTKIHSNVLMKRERALYTTTLKRHKMLASAVHVLAIVLSCL